MSGNMIYNHTVPKLREKLVALSEMDKAELKKYYKQCLKEGPGEGSKGAGLGFIEMAKKASRPIEFDFKKIDEKYSFFSVKIVI